MSVVSKLRNWSVIIPPCVNQFMAPEHKLVSLAGEVYGHENQADFPDGTKVITTGVTTVNGRLIQTAVGTHYELEGNPKDSYFQFLDKNGMLYKPEDPLSPTKKPSSPSLT